MTLCLCQVKLAISHALAQSTLLGCYEERLQVRQECQAACDGGWLLLLLPA
jgi:hypothetical protein